MPSCSSRRLTRATRRPWIGRALCPWCQQRSCRAITERPHYDTVGGAGSEPTFSVAELTGEIKDLLTEAFATVWVVGEVQRARPSHRGHFYFELVEKGRGDSIVGKLDSVIWRSDFSRVQRRLSQSSQELAEGQQIRCRGRVDFYGPGGRLQLVVREVDPVFTLGHLERRRRETLAALQAAGLMELNRRQPLPDLPLNLGLITSEGSAAYHDFLSTLGESGYGFRVVFVHAAVQGKAAEAELVSALEIAAQLRAGGRGLDALVLIRGGGSRTDLAVFDTRPVAEAVARCPLPVLTGLGHEIDQSITDLVSHTALKTPTKVAELLVEQVRTAEEAVTAVASSLGYLAERRLSRAQESLQRSERLARLAGLRLAAAAGRLDSARQALVLVAQRRVREARQQRAERVRRLLAAGPRRLESLRGEPVRLLSRIADLATGLLRERKATVEGLARLCQGLAPQRVLERGFSITRNAAGKALRSPQEAKSGEQVTTELAGGVLHSRVEEP